LECFYNDISMDGISVKCSIWYDKLIIIADYLISMCKFLVILIPITQSDILAQSVTAERGGG
jgi:hypothetical protein